MKCFLVLCIAVWGCQSESKSVSRVDLTPSRKEVPSTPIIATGTAHTCSVSPRGHVRCWGRNDQGQAGTIKCTVSATGQTNCEPTGSDLDTHHLRTRHGRRISFMHTGDSHTCAIDDVGLPYCFGNNDSFQLGYPRTAVPQPKAPLLRADFPLSPVKDICTFNDSTCAVATGGQVRCWGKATSQKWYFDRLARKDYRARELDCHASIVCVVREKASGAIITPNGKLPIGDDPTVECFDLARSDTTPRKLAFDKTPSLLSVGGAGVVCARIGEQGGQCKALTSMLINEEPIDFGNPVTAVSSAQSGQCFIASGRVFCQGGLPGPAQPKFRKTRVGKFQMKKLSLQGRAVAIDQGLSHGCVAMDDGALRCWGDNTDGQLGAHSVSMDED